MLSRSYLAASAAGHSDRNPHPGSTTLRKEGPRDAPPSLVLSHRE